MALGWSCAYCASRVLNLTRHCQVDVERTSSTSDATITQISDSDTRRLPPDSEGTGAQQAMVNSSQEVTTDTKQIQHDTMHRQESLRVRGRLEPAHLSLALPRGLM